MKTGDHEARLLAQSEFERPLMIEAGAGTGKTTTLVARILSWVLGPGWERTAAKVDDDDEESIAASVLDGVVAITFTELGAAHLAQAVAGALASMALEGGDELLGVHTDAWPVQPDDDQRRLRAGALLGALDHLTARTFHAYCRGLLATFPLESGLHPDLAIDADGSMLREACHGVVEQAFREALAEGEIAPIVRLATTGHPPPRISAALADLLGEGLDPQSLERDPFDGPGAKRFITGLRRHIAALLELGAAPLRGIGKDNAPKVIDMLEGLDRSFAAIEPSGIEAFIAVQKAADDPERCPQNLWNKLKDWRKGKFGKAEKSALGDVRKPVQGAVLRLLEQLDNARKLDPGRYELARRALAPLARQATDELRRRGVATFQSLLVESDRLLERRPDVLARLRSRIDLLLVDEVQDTDPLQYAIVRRLALEGPADKRPSLCLVGDPKQTIYGWRNADLHAYTSFLDLLRGEGGEVLQLQANFRSTPAILNEVDRLLAPTMVEQPGLQPAYTGLEAVRDEGEPMPGDRAAVEHWVSTGPGTRLEAVEEQATAAAHDILGLRRHGVALSEIAVLLRTRGPLGGVLDAFRDVGVPFAVAGDKEYYRRREIVDATSALRAVADPNDHVSLVAFLRSPWVGVPDAALPRLWAADLPGLVTAMADPAPQKVGPVVDCVRQVADAMPRDTPGIDRVEGWEHAAIDALESLAHLRRALDRDTPDIFLEVFRQRLLIEPVSAARYIGRFRLSNLERLFHRLADDLVARGGDTRSVLRALARSVTDARATEEALPKDATGEAVQILTVHQAKGLEFEHVYVLAAGQQSRGSGIPDLAVNDARGDDGQHLVLFGSPDPEHLQHRLRDDAVRVCEEARLLYVAATRARRRLVIAGVWPDKVPASLLGNVSLLSFVTHRRGLPNLAALRHRNALSEGVLDDNGVLWRHPPLGIEASHDGASGNAPAVPLPSVEVVRAAEERLGTARDGASARMRHPLSGSPSSIAHQIQQGGLVTDRARRDAALAVGTAIHELLEAWPSVRRTADREPALKQLVEAAVDRSAALAPLPARELAERRVRELAATLAGGILLDRLDAIEETALGREVPFVAPIDALRPAYEHESDDRGVDEPAEGSVTPLVAVNGTIDLLYRDPDDGAIIVADFKTDKIAAIEQEATAATYRGQLHAYALAAQAALDLESLPRQELWFVELDSIWPVE